jgi:hypothetical protein
LITQIQNYQQFGANFDNAQGGVFGARFDNELLSGTLLADTNNAVHGLTGIVNGDTGANLTADQNQILAAGSGFVADANDVSGNNVPIGGGSYVGTATTVATATSPNGVAMGSIPVTANPDIANGVGAVGEASTTGGGSTTGGTTTGGGSTPGTDPGGSGTGSPGGESGTGSPGGESATVATDIAALIQALQGGSQSAISAAITTLEAAVQGGGGGGGNGGNTGGGGGTGGAGGSAAGDPGPGPTPVEHQNHFEHMWHHV